MWQETNNILPKPNSAVEFKLRFGGVLNGTFAKITDTKGKFGVIQNEYGFISDDGTPYDARMDVSDWAYIK